MVRHVQGTLKLGHALLSGYGFSVSRRYNSLHGISALASILTAAVLYRTCANQASRLVEIEAIGQVGIERIDDVDLPTAVWGRSVITDVKDPDEMERRCAVVDGAVVAALHEARMIPDHPIGSIDAHNMEYYGVYLPKDYIMRSKHKNGTTNFVTATSSAIVSGSRTLHTACRIVRRGRPMAEYVGDLLDDNISRLIFCLYYSVDRAYFSVASMIKFASRNEYFLMYARMTPKVKRAMDAYLRGDRAAVSQYVVKSKTSKFAGTLAFWEVEEYRGGRWRNTVLPFFSNMPPGMLKGALNCLRMEMRKRQRIENGYRTAEQGMPMTTSNSPSLRTFLFHFSLLSSNLWALTDRMIKAEWLTKEGEPLPRVAEPVFGTPGWPDKEKYTITYKEFCRIIHTEATRLAIRDKHEQDEYEEEACEEFAHLFEVDEAKVARLVKERARERIAAGPLFVH